MKRIDKLFLKLKAMEGGKGLYCRTADGTEKPMGIIEALHTGATFIRTIDGSHDFDELYKAVLNAGSMDFSELPEVGAHDAASAESTILSEKRDTDGHATPSGTETKIRPPSQSEPLR